MSNYVLDITLKFQANWFRQTDLSSLKVGAPSHKNCQFCKKMATADPLNGLASKRQPPKMVPNYILDIQ